MSTAARRRPCACMGSLPQETHEHSHPDWPNVCTPLAPPARRVTRLARLVRRIRRAQRGQL